MEFLNYVCSGMICKPMTFLLLGKLSDTFNLPDVVKATSPHPTCLRTLKVVKTYRSSLLPLQKIHDCVSPPCYRVLCMMACTGKYFPYTCYKCIIIYTCADSCYYIIYSIPYNSTTSQTTLTAS